MIEPTNNLDNVSASVVQNQQAPQTVETKQVENRTSHDGTGGMAIDTAEVARSIQDNLKALHDVDLQFSVHEASGQIVVTVVDETTGKVIREIPSPELLALASKIDETIGLVFDQRG